MSAITSKTFTYGPTLRSIPRGAVMAADVALAGGRLLSRLLRTKTAPRANSRVAEAEEVRELARRWERTDPGFAADLRSAAARHEGQGER